MFDFIRNHQKLMQFILLLFIAPAFVLLGVSGYSGGNSNANALATVGDYGISQEEFDQVKRNRIEEARRQAGANFDPKVFDTPEANRQILQSIVSEYLVQKAVEAEFLTASDNALRKNIQETELFQVDGRFNLDTYKRELAARGVTPAQYDDNLRFSLARVQVFNPMLEGVFFSKTLASQVDDAQLAGRVVQTKTIGLDEYLAQATVTQQEIAQYYDKNLSTFQVPAMADVEYLVLSPEAVKSGLQVSEQDMAAYYAQNKARYATPEERNVKHILLPAKKEGVSDAELEKKAKAVLAEVKASPAQFESLAKKYSIDTGSAEQGGVLGYFGRGAMVPEFDKAMFDLPKNTISDLVKTQYGYHILVVVDVRGGQQKTFDEVKNQIADEIKAQKLTVAFAQAQETFSEKVYEAGQSFEPVAKPLSLTPKTLTGLLSTGGKDVPAELADPKVLAEIFSEESVRNRNNIRAIQVGDSLVSARVLKYTPAAPKALALVQTDIAARLKLEKAQLAASKDADAIAAKLNASKADAQVLAGFGEIKTVSALDAQGLPPLVAQSVLDTGASDLPKAKVVGLGANGYVVTWVSGLAASSTIKQRANPQVLQFYDSLADQAYQEAIALAAREALSERVGVKIKKTF